MFHICLFILLLASASAGVVKAKNRTPTVRSKACLPPHHHYPFCNTSLTVAERTWDLISRIRIEDIPPLLTARGQPRGNMTALPYLGVPAMDWGLNCVHGVQSACINGTCPTSFPSPPSLGASWNSTNILRMAQIMGVEVRALWLAGAREPSTWSGEARIGLDCWSPNINIVRDPRWGRNQETASEDPLMNGLYAKEYSIGMQVGQDARFLQSIPTLKHWAAYSLDDSDGFTRYDFNAIVSKYDMHDTYLPAFRRGFIEGNAQGVMCSYNALNGTPTCGSSYLSNILRHEWNFTGYQTSDTGALGCFFPAGGPGGGGHNYTSNRPKGACEALAEGRTDMNSGRIYIDHLMEGVKQGYCNMTSVRQALFDTLHLRFKLGLFDPTEDQPYWEVPMSKVNTAATQSENLRMAEQGLVLLKNERNILPLDMTEGSSPSVAFIGPTANSSSALLSNYLGTVCPEGFGSSACVQTVYDAARSSSSSSSGGSDNNSFTYAQGCDHTGMTVDHQLFAEAIRIAKAADVVVMVMGLNQQVEAEMHDRVNISLPGVQSQLIKAVSAVNANIVLVLTNGGAVAIEDDLPHVKAVLEAWYPGVMGAKAIINAIFGKTTPGGRLPVTMYRKDFVDQIPMSQMSMRQGVGRSYRYYAEDVIYPFGHGLTYGPPLIATATKVMMDHPVGGEDEANMQYDGDISSRNLQFEIEITSNVTHDKSSYYPKSTVVQAYVVYGNLTQSPLTGDLPTSRLPFNQLAAYQRYELTTITTKKKAKKFVLAVEKDDVFCTVSDSGVRQVFPGDYYLVFTTKDATGGYLAGKARSEYWHGVQRSGRLCTQ